MLQFIGALNEEPEDLDKPKEPPKIRKDEEESEALALYNNALASQQIKDLSAAEDHFKAVLKLKIIQQVTETSDVDRNTPAALLKYSTYKNLGKIYKEKNDLEAAQEHFLEAALVDETDVTLWILIGKTALETTNVVLAKYAFEKALTLSPQHWFCLDNIITLLYVIGDYSGLALRDQMFKEESFLVNDFRHLEILLTTPGREEESRSGYQKIVEEALILREKHRLLSKHEEPHQVKLSKHMAYFSWSCLGESLYHLYEETMESIATKSLCWPVDLERYYKTADQQESLPVQPHEHPGRKSKANSKDNEEKKSIKRKKILSNANNDLLEPIPKRRSARTKGAKQREEEVNWISYFQTYLPSVASALPDSQDEESQCSIIDESETLSTLHSSPLSIASKTAEAKNVSKFINSNIQNGGCMILLTNWLIASAINKQGKWEPSLRNIYNKIFIASRKSFVYPEILGEPENPDFSLKFSKLCLFATELQLSYLLKLSHSISPSQSPIKAKQKASASKLFDSQDHREFLSDLQFLNMISSRLDVLKDFHLEFSIRVAWLQSQVFMLQGLMDRSLNGFNKCMDLIKDSKCGRRIYVLDNLDKENLISIETVEKRLESLYSCQSLEEVQQLFEDEKYDKVVQLLKHLMNKDQSNNKNLITSGVQPEKTAQWMLLQQAMFEMKDFAGCFRCSGLILSSAVVSATPCQAWRETFKKVLQCLESCFKSSPSLLTIVQPDDITVLVKSLVKMIEVSVEMNDNGEQPYATISPWVILYKTMKHFGFDITMHKVAEEDVSTESSSTVQEHSIIDFISSAHDHMGRRTWCCHGNGTLLLQFVEDLHSELSNKASKFSRKDILKELEQCFLCLYGHPSKKPKNRILQDHSATQISLTWEYAKIVYDVFQPNPLPTLDSKLNTVSIEVQNLMRRIVTVVPQKEVEVINFDTLQSFVDGVIDFPTIPEDEIARKRTPVHSVFYCLADFFFKNKEFSKAIKYYTHDVCLNPRRFESWAAMALGRGSRLEEKINACEPKSDGPIKKSIVSTLRCFEMASAINTNSCMIFEEYGSTAYMLNSHASRIQRENIQDEEFTKENEIALLERRKNMLLLAEDCFTKARLCVRKENGEPWLHSYILGKVAEKLKKPKKIYFGLYARACHELHEAGASYPKRIPYHGPPEFAIESLEIYYRLHASILSVLIKTEGIDYDELEGFVTLATEWPFIKRKDSNVLSQNSSGILSPRKSMKPDQSIQDLIVGNARHSATYVEDSNTNSQDNANDSQIMSSILSSPPSSCGLKKTNENIPVETFSQSYESSQQSSLDLAEYNIKQESIENFERKEDEENSIKGSISSVAVINNSIPLDDSASIINDSPVFNTISNSTPIAKNFDSTQREGDSLQNNTNVPVINVSDTDIDKSSSENIYYETSLSFEFTDNSNPQTKSSPISEHSVKNQNIPLELRLSDEINVNGDFTKPSSPKDILDTLFNEESHSKSSPQTILDLDIADHNIADNGSKTLNDPVQMDNDLKNSDKKEIDIILLQKTCSELDEKENKTSKDERTTTEATMEIDKLFENPIDENLQSSDNTKEVESIVISTQGESLDNTFDVEMQQNVPDNEKKKENIEETSHQQNVSTKANNDSSPDGSLNELKKHNRTFDSVTDELKYRRTVDQCIAAFSFCLKRFPEHYKSQYRMAYCYTYLSTHKDLHVARDLLLGISSHASKDAQPTIKLQSLGTDMVLPTHGMFSDRSKTNLFHHLWRIPIDEIDRAGSFCSHICRAVELLLHVLTELDDWEALINVSLLLHRTPEKDRKYLRDNDRVFLAIKALDLVHDIMKKRISQLSEGDSHLAKPLVIDCYEVLKHTQKMQTSIKTSEHMLVKCYVKMLEINHEDTKEIPASILLDMAMRFSQSKSDQQKKASSQQQNTIEQPILSTSDQQNSENNPTIQSN